MKIERLRCFLSVARTLNFSQSAKELYLSQPSISRIIRSLEDEVGAPLLNRNGKQMTLTQEGEIFLRHCKKMVSEWDKAITEIRTFQMESHTLTVGMIGFAEERLMAAIDFLGKKYPQLALQIVPVDFSRPFEALESDLMDCLLYWPELKPESVEYLPLFEGEIHAYLNKNHSLCQKEKVSIKDIVSIPNIVFGNISGPTDPAYLRDVPQELKKNLKFIKVPDVMTSRRMLELNQGVVLSPAGGILNDSEEIREITITEYSRLMQMGLCYKKDNKNPALMELLHYLKNE